jgi:uncharacterized membrane protein YphA (DoxX/SURF4 family)
MLENLLRPQLNSAALMLRLGLAAIFVPHGIFKVVQQYALIEQISLSTQQIVGWTELACGLALMFGLFSRLAALAVIAMQLGAIILVTGEHALMGPDINARGADYTRVGPEFNLVLIVMCSCVILLGSGAWSLDYLILRVFSKSSSSVAPPAPAGPLVAVR